MPASISASDDPSIPVSIEPAIVSLIESISEPIVEPAIVPAAMSNAEPVVPAPPIVQAYHCNQVSTTAPPTSSSSSGTPYPLSSYLSYANLSSNHRHFCNAISSIVEPKHYDQAVFDPH